MRMKQIFALINGILVVTMIAVSLVLFLTIYSMRIDNEWVTHTYEVIHESEHLLIDMLNQETGMRGYLATGDNKYLEPYNEASSRFNSNLNGLKELVSDNPAQVSRLEEIERLSYRWHDEAANNYLTIKREIVSAEQIREEVRNLTTSEEGRKKMDVAIELVGDIDDDLLSLNIAKSMISMETSVQGFFIKEDNCFLDSYHVSKSNLNSYLQQLNDPTINAYIYEWVEEIAEKEIEFVNESKIFKDETDLYRELSYGLGKTIMDQIRGEVDRFIDVEKDLLVERKLESAKKINVSIIVIFIGFVMVLLMSFIQRVSMRRVTNPLMGFIDKMKKLDVKNIDEEVAFKTSRIIEIEEITTSFSDLVSELKYNQDSKKKSDWILQGQIEISSISESSQKYDVLPNNLISYLTKKLNGHFGAIYLLNEYNGNDEFILVAGYALDHDKKSFRPGEGLMGQAAIEGEIIRVNDMDEEAKNKSESMVIIPYGYNDKVIAVAKIVSKTHITDLMLDFLVRTKSSIGIATNNMINLNKIQDLLEETQDSKENIEAKSTELEDKVTRLEMVERELNDLTRIDQLTSINNRRAFDETLDLEWIRSIKSRSSIALLIIDIDYFKSYNDAFGHIEGDICLKRVATEIKNTLLRPSDCVFRYGGEEFVVLLPNTDLVGAEKVSENIRSNIEKLGIENVVAEQIKTLTVSIGGTCMHPSQMDRKESIISQADQAMYKAKSLGRNRWQSFKME